MKFLFQTGTGLFILLILSAKLEGQEAQKRYAFESYVSSLQSVITDSIRGNWISDNLIHNRVGFYWYPDEHFTFSVQVRSRLIYGESVKLNSEYAGSLENDIGFMDLSMNLFDEKSFILNTTSDRLFLKYSNGKFVSTIGRQRINWGQNYVWNPNDIFNVQNFFDFDYPEKPGSDAIRLQYYTGEASEAELAVKLDHNRKMTAAAFYRFNKWSYDYQFLGGVFEGSDLVAGAGFAGHISSAGFNGELSYFRPMKNFQDTGSIFILGLGADYVFSNSLYIQAEGLFQQSNNKVLQGDFISWYSGNLNVKKLSLTDFSVYTGISYPFTPLLNASLSCTLFPEIEGVFAGPTIRFSAADNIELSLIILGFRGILPDPLTGVESVNSLFLGFLRGKINF